MFRAKPTRIWSTYKCWVFQKPWKWLHCNIMHHWPVFLLLFLNNRSSTVDQFIVIFALSVRFVEDKKNIENCQPYPLISLPSIFLHLPVALLIFPGEYSQTDSYWITLLALLDFSAANQYNKWQSLTVTLLL